MPLDRSEILLALEALADELARAGTQIELAVVGGAAIVLLYQARSSTKDVDAFVVGQGDAAAVRSAARSVATRLALPDDWLNDAAKGYVQGRAPGDTILQKPFLTVRALAAHQLLAMKLCAWRDDLDISDATLLLSKLPFSRDRVWSLVEPHLVPGRELKARYAFDDLWEATHGSP